MVVNFSNSFSKWGDIFRFKMFIFRGVQVFMEIYSILSIQRPPPKEPEIPTFGDTSRGENGVQEDVFNEFVCKKHSLKWDPFTEMQGHNRFPTPFCENGWTSRWWNLLESIAQDLLNGSHVLSRFVWQFFSPVFSKWFESRSGFVTNLVVS